jgi:heat shock protein HslJ
MQPFSAIALRVAVEPCVAARRQVGVLTVVRILCLAVALGGCSLLGGQAASLEGRTFLSTGVTDGDAPHDLVAGTRIRISFNAGGAIGVSAGCNIMGGSYRLEGGTLRFEGGSMTEMGCDPERHAQDDWLFEFLGSGPSVALSGNDLVLTSGLVVIRLLDREIAEPDLALVGTTWTVASIVDGGAVSSVPVGVVATLVFGADGRVAVSTGCNDGGGTYAVAGESMTFSDVALTKRACDGAAGQMEAAVLAVITADRVLFGVDANMLSLRVAGGGLDLSGG